jgi:hypothetical protein
LRTIRLLVPVVLSLCLLSSASPAEEKPLWRKSGRTYHTAHLLPEGTEVRIRVVRSGKALMRLVDWVGKKKDTWRELTDWSGGDLRDGQVIRYTLPREMRIGVRIGGKDARKARGLEEHFGYHQLRFGERWVVDVKLVDPTI